MAKKGSASATIGLDYAAFEAGAKAVMKVCEQMGSFIKNTLAVAAGNILASAFNRGASALSSFFGSMRDNLANVFTLGESLANLSHATGMLTGDYLKFTTAAEKGITFSEAGKLLGRNAELMQKDAGLFRDISLKLFAVGERIQGFWIGVADKIAPVINPLLDRLIALDLSSWGQAFAEPIANAVKIIYQLAVDGNLWKTMGDFAAAAFTYAAEILGKLIGIYTHEGFVAGLTSMWTGIKAVVVYLWESLKSIMSNASEILALGMLMSGNGLRDAVEQIMVSIGDGINALVKFQTFGQVDTRGGFMRQDEADFEKNERDEFTDNAAKNIALDEIKEPSWAKSNGSLLDQIKEAISSTSFGTPELSERISSALDKFQNGAEKNADKNSNQSFSMNYGVSSLASVGGGGGVGMLSLTQHAEIQTKAQEQIRDNSQKILEFMQSNSRGNMSQQPGNMKTAIV
jgi:hypothetical protein